MNIILYIFIFIIGITFGSFFTLAVYRIPLGQDITHKRSYCPNCNHRLEFWDMIPIFSYIFLGGKCRYCGKKIRSRYLLLEIFSGLVFVLFAVSINLNINNILCTGTISYLISGMLYIATLFIIAGIDKEKIQIQNSVLLFGIIVETLYMIYLYIVDKFSIYTYVIYLVVLVLLVIINTIYLKKKMKNNYTIQILLLILMMLVFTYEVCTITTIIFTLLSISIKLIIDKIKQKNIKYKKIVKEESLNKIPFGFYLCVTNIITMIVINLVCTYNIHI